VKDYAQKSKRPGGNQGAEVEVASEQRVSDTRNQPQVPAVKRRKSRLHTHLRRSRNQLHYGRLKLLGASTAGQVLRALRRLDPHTTSSLTDAYLMLCARSCGAQPCCRPDYREE
jgi:hypothetical protein